MTVAEIVPVSGGSKSQNESVKDNSNSKNRSSEGSSTKDKVGRIVAVHVTVVVVVVVVVVLVDVGHIVDNGANKVETNTDIRIFILVDNMPW